MMKNDEALEKLKIRFVNGEIDEETKKVIDDKSVTLNEFKQVYML